MDNSSSISEAPPPVENVENTIAKLKDDLKGENDVDDVTNGECNKLNDHMKNGKSSYSAVNTTSVTDEANIAHEGSSNVENSNENVVADKNGDLSPENKNNDLSPENKNNDLPPSNANGVPATSKENIQNDNEDCSAVSGKQTEDCDMVDEATESKNLQLNAAVSSKTEDDGEDLKEPAEEMHLNSDTDEESTEMSTNSDSSDEEEEDELDADELPVRVRPKRGSSGASATNNSEPLPIDDASKDNEADGKGESTETVQKRKRNRRKNLELLNLGIDGTPKYKGSSGEEGKGEQSQQKLRRRSHRISDDSSIGDEEVKEAVVKEKRERRSIHDFGFICDDEDEPPQRKKQRRSIKNPSDPTTNKSPRKPRNGGKDEDRSSTLEEQKYAKNLYRPKVSYHELKRTREVFIQYKKCIDFNTKNKKIKVPICLDCKQQLSGVTKITIEKCRFYGFRKLKVTPKCTLSCGLSDPYTDPADEDKDLWRPLPKQSVTREDINTAQFIVSFVGDQFCDLAQGEMSTLSLKDEDDPVVWKRTVKSLREMCDVCSTTLFHYQWICEKCGFVACKDCHHSRLIKDIKPQRHGDPEYDEYMWRKCSANKFNKLSVHSLDELLLAQVIVGDTLTDLYKLVHKVRHDWNIAQTCGCPEALKYATEPPPTIAVSAPVVENKIVDDEDSNDSSDDEGVDPDLMALLGCPAPSEKPAAESSTSASNAKVSEVVPVEKKEPVSQPGKFRRPPTLPRYHIVTKEKYPTVQHAWLCDGKLLRLMEPTNPDNWQIFQEVWKGGQPVLISHVDKYLDQSLWTPQSFSNDFGRMKGVFVNCMTGKLVMNQLMKVFWDGFEVVPNRLEDEQGNAMLLKLKDWPEKADFADVLPSRFKDLMKALPLQDYTSREGRFNLASYLPDKFVKPDLGPKMYVAYGSGMHLEKGTTNLHLDISDAANVMVYIGEPSDTPENTQIHREAVIQAIKDSDCDVGTIRRVIEGKDIPGALWHIYEARDSDKIRNFLNENKVKQGIRPDERADPIHDQSCYLDKQLRKDLMERYDIRGYAIIQCAGDAIFIPAGAPHQVRNLQNCIKVAEDFVSPENVHHCFKLTQEFRKLSESHSNHEDKLQIKNIVYHSIKDSVAVFLNEGKVIDSASASANTPQTNMDVEDNASTATTTTPQTNMDVEDNTIAANTITPQTIMDVEDNNSAASTPTQPASIDVEDNNSTASTIPESS